MPYLRVVQPDPQRLLVAMSEGKETADSPDFYRAERVIELRVQDDGQIKATVLKDRQGELREIFI